MEHFICKTCGTQFPATAVPPEHCPICEDERQYIGWEGQQWTTQVALQQDHQNKIEDEEPNLTGIGTVPGFAIGQRALLVQTPQGNLLWDCITILIPLPAKTVREIVTAVFPYPFDRIYGAWWGRVVKHDAKTAVSRSAERYIAALTADRT